MKKRGMATLLAVLLGVTAVCPQSAAYAASVETETQSEPSEIRTDSIQSEPDTEQSAQSTDNGRESGAENSEDEDDSQRPLEKIRLDKTSLVMKTGEQKELHLSFVPEDTTEDPEIVWKSDDPAVAEVTGDGKTATVTAAEGNGGTATITATAGGCTATCRVLVTVQEPMLESIVFMQNSSGSNRYELSEEDGTGQEYTLRIPESTNVVFVRPQLREDIEESATITAKFTDAYTKEEREVTLPVDEVTSLSSTATGRLIRPYNIEPTELEITVTYKDRTETCQIHVVRGSYLGSLSLSDANGQNIAFTPAFDKRTYAYSLHVPSSLSELHLTMKGAEETSTCLTVNGEIAENGAYTLPLTERKVTAVIRAGDGELSSPYEYTLTVYVDEVCYLTTVTEPETAVVAVYDADKQKIDPVDGRYELIKGDTYTYTVAAVGYKSLEGSFTAGDDEEKTFTLEKNQESQQEEVDSEWGGYWNTKDNMNIIEAETPSSLSEAEVLWKKQYGVNVDYNNSISDGILVQNYICCFQGQTLLYLDKTTGETVQSVQMLAKGNSAFNKPLYAAGMIIVPLNNGRVQAFNAKTLKSLWVYTDTVGGNTATAIRYDDGYLYVGFADGNLVCLLAADEDPENEREEKTAVWRQYDSNGYYHTGVYTEDDYLYACGHSGTIYCLNKKTGQTIQKITLADTLGAPSTAIIQAKGRLYFATEKGYLCSYALNSDKTIDTTGAKTLFVGGTIYGTPLIYKDRLYVGSGQMDQYGVVHSPYAMNVVMLGADGTMSLAYQMEVRGCPKGTPTLTTAYEKQDGYAYVYFTTDTSNGSLYLLKDKAGCMAPGDGSGLFYQQNDVAGNGSGSVLVDKAGNMYFRYESAWMYALKSSTLFLKNVTVADAKAVIDTGDAFDGQAENHTVVLEKRTDTVTMQFEVEEGVTVSINGQEGAKQEISLTDGQAQIQVVLKKDTQTRTYTFAIRCKSTDASLETLQVSFSSMVTVMEMELAPAFQKDILEYSSSIYGSGRDREPYYVWPISSDSRATVKVTAVSGVSGVADGEEITPSVVAYDTVVRNRYRVKPAYQDQEAVIRIEVTAEDGTTTKGYTLHLFRNNDTAKLTVGQDPILTRKKDSVTLRVNSSLDGYLYYLSERGTSSDGMPTANEVRTQGQRVAISKGDNVVTLENIVSEKGMLYLYSMSYAQRFSNGVQVELPAYSGGETPPDSGKDLKGDLNKDGLVDLTDAVLLLDRVTAGTADDPDNEDLNGDGVVDLTDAVTLLEMITKK